MGRTFVGFGFGAIQGGLFLPEAFGSGNFSRMVVSEIDVEIVAALRASGSSYSCNVASATAIETVHVECVEIFNPLVEEDRTALVQAIAEASELATALPSVTLYDAGEASAAKLLAQGLAEGAFKEGTVLCEGEIAGACAVGGLEAGERHRVVAQHFAAQFCSDISRCEEHGESLSFWLRLWR